MKVLTTGSTFASAIGMCSPGRSRNSTSSFSRKAICRLLRYDVWHDRVVFHFLTALPSVLPTSSKLPARSRMAAMSSSIP